MVETLGIWALQGTSSTMAFFSLSGRAAFGLVDRIIRLKFRWRETVNQMYQIGVLSIPVMAFSLSFIGIIITLEFSFHMKLVLQQDSLVPAFSTVLLIRELGPVITCIILTSRVGASIAAEIATMKITDQIDALRILAIDPVEYLLIPRWVASVFAAVAISIVSISMAILSGALISSFALGIPLFSYFNTMFTFAKFADFQWVLIKSSLFGTLIPLIAAHHGFRASYGAEGVGNAATLAVVHGTMLIIVTDFLLTYWLYSL